MTNPHEHVNPSSMAPAVGYSHAVVAVPGRLVKIGGQVAMDGNGSVVGATLAEQYSVALGNVVTALEAAGGKPSDLVSMTVFVTDITAYRADLPELGAAHRDRVGRHFPAMALVAVTALVEPDAMVEIVAEAVIPSTSKDDGTSGQAQ